MIRDNPETTADWAPVGAMFKSILEDVPRIAVTVTALIRRSIPAYLAVAEEEHLSAVADQLQIRLSAFAARSPVDAVALDTAARLAATRAAQGISIDAVIAAYQAGDQEIWQLVADRASPEVGPMMPEIGRMLFAATSATTEVMARAHTRVARDIDSGRITLAHQFLELLESPGEHVEATLAATRLGFDPVGTFTGLAWKPEASPAASYEAASSLRSGSIGLAIRATGEGRFEMVAQTDDIADLVAEVTERLCGGRLGVGLKRHGVAGGGESVADARMALEATSSKRSVVWFATHWHEAPVLAESRRLGPLTTAGVEVAREHPHLAETVVAFADCDMSIAATAQRIHLHANSVTYRLDRWGSMTGLNPRSFAGLSQSLIVCRLADRV